MTDKEFRRLSRSELIEVMHEMQENADSNGYLNVDLPTMEQVEAEHKGILTKQRIWKMVRSTISVLIVVAAAAVLISTLFLPIIQVSGDSMEPSLHNGDIMMLHKTSNFEHGELCCISWQNKLLLKRIIGLPGDTIDIDSKGNVFVNGKYIDEPYVTKKSIGECDITFPYEVPEAKLFILGDRRDVSIDSRSTAVGCVEKEQIVGVVLFKLWPLGK